MRAVVGLVTVKGEHVTIARAMKNQIVVANCGRTGDRHVLAVRGGNGNDGLEFESVRAETDRAIQRNGWRAGIGNDTGKGIEIAGMTDAFATAGMANDHDVVRIHFSIKGVAGGRMPDEELA